MCYQDYKDVQNYKQMKHKDIKYHFIRERIQESVIICYLSKPSDGYIYQANK